MKIEIKPTEDGYKVTSDSTQTTHIYTSMTRAWKGLLSLFIRVHKLDKIIVEIIEK